MAKPEIRPSVTLYGFADSSSLTAGLGAWKSSALHHSAQPQILKEVLELQEQKGLCQTYPYSGWVPQRKYMTSCLLKVMAKCPCSPPLESSPAFWGD